MDVRIDIKNNTSDDTDTSKIQMNRCNGVCQVFLVKEVNFPLLSSVH